MTLTTYSPTIVIPTGVKQYPIVTRPRQSKLCPGLRNQQGCHPERAKWVEGPAVSPI